MYRVVIIDDEPQARIALSQMLTDFCENISILGDADGVESGYKLITETQPDVIFLDIMMKDGSGFSLLDKLPSRNFKVIFTTAFDNYAIKAFKYSAIDYLLKPINPLELIDTVSKLDQINITSLEQIQIAADNKLDKIAIPTSQGIMFVKIENIIRCKSDNSYTTFYFTNGSKSIVSRSIGEWDKVLPENNFIRVHQSYIVNIDLIKMFKSTDGGTLLTIDDAEIPVSRAKKEELKLRLGL